MTEWSSKNALGQALTKLADLMLRLERVRQARLAKAKADVVSHAKRMQVDDE